MSILPISPVEALGTFAPTSVAAPARIAGSASFADLLTQSIDTATTKVAAADRLVARAVVDDSIPLHHVTYALEEARLSFELLIQVRNRLIDATQQLTNMQL